MPGKTIIACTSEQYNTLITLIYEGVGNSIQPNPRVATVLVVEANTGLRIGDILTLRLNDIIKDGNRYRFNITEKKTGKSGPSLYQIRSMIISKNIMISLRLVTLL